MKCFMKSKKANMTEVKVSIVIITLVRESLYSLVEMLLEQSTDFSYEIVVIPHKAFDKEKLNCEKVNVYPQEDGKGLSLYRNKGVKKAKGEIVVFIDDDEIPKNTHWLELLVKPILNREVLVTTAGTDIPLRQGYFADSISLLGYPGGAALGFKALWQVDYKGYTKHLCTGNFAIKKSLFEDLGAFDESLKSGAEDVFLSHQIEKNAHKIKFIEEATIEHAARKSLLEFVKWHFVRGKAIAEYSKLQLIAAKDVGRLFRILRLIIKKSFLTPYFPMVLLLWPIQYLCQSMGLIYAKLRN